MKALNKGSVLGILHVASLVKLTIGIPILLLYILTFIKKVKLPKLYKLIFFLIVFKLFWISSIFLAYSNKSFFSLLQSMVPDFTLLVVLFVSVNGRLIQKYFTPLLLLFSVDLIFNIAMVVFGVDFFGRVGGIGEHDFLPRLIGVFGHPYQSINIAFVAFIIGVFLKSKNIMFLSFLPLILTGSLRGPLVAIVLLVTMFLLYKRVRLSLISLVFVIFIGLVFVATIYSASHAGYESGNYLRVLAWTSAIEHIMNNPIFGTQIFLSGTFEHMSSKAILDYGIAESYYLQYALDYGLFPALISFVVFFLIVKVNIKKLYSAKRLSSRYFAIVLLTITIFVDSFYGTLYGSHLVTVFYSILGLAYLGARKEGSV